MKKILTLLLFLSLTLNAKLFSQNFEGTITWTAKMEITDPQRKKQMEDAQKQMSDPTTQAKMKQLEAQLKDPQFKAMMENNPQLKAQIEKMVGAMQTGDVNSMFPKGMTIKIKNEDVLSKFDGGMFSQEILFLQAKNQSYTIDRDSKTYSVMGQSEKKETTNNSNVKVTKTNETKKILNYNCTKYLVETTSNGKTVVQHVWATTDIKDFNFKALSRQRLTKDQPLFYESIDGVPLKMTMDVDGIKIDMEVTDISKGSLPASDFTIPAGFKEVAPMFR
jgi:hypothetical protein